MNKVLIIGCGHMGSALIDAWLNLKSYSFTIVDPFNYNNLKKKYNKKKIQIFNKTPIQDQINKFDIIIFAVTPQVAEKVVNDYKDFKFKKNSMIGTIIAGKKINFYKKYLKSSKQIVRIMPNMPALVRNGITCLVPNKHFNKKNRKIIDQLFLKVGKTVWLDNESQIDIATAISGSGPGYIFGFSKKLSRELILSTFLGSLKLMEKTKKEPDDLANSIAIKGGTTEAGIKVLKKNKINNIIYNTFLAAYKRASILGKK